MLEEGGDWDRRNRLKVYEGLYAMPVRDFKLSAKLFLNAISTFTSYELMDYVKWVLIPIHNTSRLLSQVRRVHCLDLRAGPGQVAAPLSLLNSLIR